LNYFMPKYSIDSDKEVAAFIAQIGHESGYLRYSEEIASGKAYEGRRDLGNIYAGDGMKYKGRGLIQITGRYNYAQLSKDLGEDFIKNPELLSTPKYAVQSACWFWNKNKLNDLV
jgi:putative chitinase